MTDEHVDVAHLKQLVVDCRHPTVLARFWAAALDEFELRVYDEVEIERLASFRHTPETDPRVIVDGPNLELCFQEVEVPDAPKKPLHIDFAASSRAEESSRPAGLGATVVQNFGSHTWMRDPEGNDFCVTDA